MGKEGERAIERYTNEGWKVRGGKRREEGWNGGNEGNNESKIKLKWISEVNWGERQVLINILCQDKLIKHEFCNTSDLLFSGLA